MVKSTAYPRPVRPRPLALLMARRRQLVCRNRAVSTTTVTFLDGHGNHVCAIRVLRNANGALQSTTCSCLGFDRHGSCVHVWTTALIVALFGRYRLAFTSMRIRWDGIE